MPPFNAPDIHVPTPDSRLLVAAIKRQPFAPCFTCRAQLPCSGGCTATINRDLVAWNGRRFDTLIRVCHKGE